ncbi:hypothetical protein B0H12DRAFT_1083308, partial [Mycena haematopus]
PPAKSSVPKSVTVIDAEPSDEESAPAGSEAGQRIEDDAGEVATRATSKKKGKNKGKKAKPTAMRDTDASTIPEVIGELLSQRKETGLRIIGTVRLPTTANPVYYNGMPAANTGKRYHLHEDRVDGDKLQLEELESITDEVNYCLPRIACMNCLAAGKKCTPVAFGTQCGNCVSSSTSGCSWNTDSRFIVDAVRAMGPWMGTSPEYFREAINELDEAISAAPPLVRSLTRRHFGSRNGSRASLPTRLRWSTSSAHRPSSVFEDDVAPEPPPSNRTVQVALAFSELVKLDALDSFRAFVNSFEVQKKDKGKGKVEVVVEEPAEDVDATHFLDCKTFRIMDLFSKPEVASFMLKVLTYQDPSSPLSLAVATLLNRMQPPLHLLYFRWEGDLCSFVQISFWNEWLEAFDQGFKDRWSRMQFTIPSRAAALYLELYMLRDFLPLYFGTPSQSTILALQERVAEFNPGSSLDCPLCVTRRRTLPSWFITPNDFIHYPDDEDRDDYDSYLTRRTLRGAKSLFTPHTECFLFLILMDDHEVFLHLGYESVPAPVDVPVYQNPNSALSRAVRRLLLKMSVLGNLSAALHRNWLQNNYTSPPVALLLHGVANPEGLRSPLHRFLDPRHYPRVGGHAANFHIVDTRLLRPVQDVIRGVIPPDSTFAVGLVSLLRSLCIPRLIGRLEGDQWNTDVPAQEAAEAWDDADLYNAE